MRSFIPPVFTSKGLYTVCLTLFVFSLCFSQSNLVITEIFSGQEGDDLTADWFEIKNIGNAAWIQGVDPDISYDDESADAADAVIVQGITDIQPNATVVILITGDTLDLQTFKDVWSPVIDLSATQIGWADGAGLGGGGDAVTIWIGDPSAAPTNMASYPDTQNNDGQSYNVEIGAFSSTSNGGVTTIAVNVDNGIPNIGTPGDGAPIINNQLKITEIFPGQAGDDLTADWFEITNVGTHPWIATIDGELFYDDESMDSLDATIVIGIDSILPGKSAIVMIGGENDANQFLSIWNPVANLSDIPIGYTDGAGLGGGGDLVTLWKGSFQMMEDTASYPSTDENDGQSFDVDLLAFSVVGNLNNAVQTLAVNMVNGIPNIGSPGNQGPAVVNPNAPSIKVNPDLTTARLNVSQNSPSFVSGVIGDPTDPASEEGIVFIVNDNNSDFSDITLTVNNDNQEVVPDGNLNISQLNDSTFLITITPLSIGYATITLSVTDETDLTQSYVISYAASGASENPELTLFHTGASDASTAVTIDSDHMFVADDEDQIIRLYDRNKSGYPLNEFNFNNEIGDDEVDFEGSFSDGDTIFWIGSLITNERSVIMKTIQSGSGADAALTFAGQYRDLRVDLINWDNNDGHGKGAGFYDFATNFEVEGLAMDPNNPGGALLGFRAPLINGKALIVPINNFSSIVSPEPVSNTAIFGTPIEIDLARHSIRSIDCNENGCLIIGGPVENITDFRLFTWSGNREDQPELRAADIMSLIPAGSFEGIIGLPQGDFMGANGDSLEVNLLVDMGTFDFYQDGTEAKDLPYDEWKKSRSERVMLDSVEVAPVALPGDIIITEVMQNPAMVSDEDGEWFELFNASFLDIDLNGWFISDNGSDIHQIDNGAPLVIPAGEYLVIGANTDITANGGVDVAYSYGSSSVFALGNGNDEIILKAPDSLTIDSIAWDGGTTWPDPNGASMSLLNPNLDNNDGANWCEATNPYGDGDLGTPGIMNDCPMPPSANLQITEAWVGFASGTDITNDWFEITNFGSIDWVQGVDPDIYYDDESQDPAVADIINGVDRIPAGQSVIVVIGNEADADNFNNIWAQVYDLDGVAVGHTDGAGLGQGGDGVTLFLGTPSVDNIVDFESFNAVPSGVSWDVVIGAFSQEGVGIIEVGTNIAAATSVQNSEGLPAIASPGNKGPLNTPEFTLQITEIFSGQEGNDLTADWFEIVNVGNAPWMMSSNTSLFYDDESMSPTDATEILGLTEILPGQLAIVLITGDTMDMAIFRSVWNPVIDLSDVHIGWTDGAGLGGGGDLVTLWVGNPENTPVDTASYPDVSAFDGRSYDVLLGEFSTVGNAKGAVQTNAVNSDFGIPNIGSPGNGLARSQFDGLVITEIFSGQAGDDLTADWFEITNNGSEDWMSGVHPDLFYDDESAAPGEATLIDGIEIIEQGTSVIVVIGTAADTADFRAVWEPVINLSEVEIGFTDGAGLGGGGDIVTLWIGDPNLFVPFDQASYPDTELNNGQTFDVDLAAFSVVGNENGAVQTLALGGNNDTPNIGSPGNLGPVTSTTTQLLSTAVKVYPNPSIGIFQIEAEDLLLATIYDLVGRKVLLQSLTGNNATLNLTNLNAGTYFLYLSTSKGTIYIPLVKL